MLVEGNILDPIQPELDKSVWDHPNSDRPVLKPQHAHWITRTVHEALDKAGYSHPEKWLELVLTGSLTTYQYSKDSDVDISLFVMSSKLPEWSRAEMIGIMIENVDGTLLPGTTHPMQCYVVPREIKKGDLYKEGLRSGYDIKTEKWIEPPDHSRDHDVEAVENGFFAYAQEQADKMEKLLRYEPDKAVSFWHQIHKRRQRDQAAGKGDFSESNIVYKFLNNRGLFPAIAQQSGEYIAKQGMAADPYWLDNWMERNGPILYHRTDRSNLDSIRQHGIIPADDPRGPGPQDTGYLTPRPGHTYMRHLPDGPQAQKKWGDESQRVDLPIDIRKLDPNLMNPDEDAMYKREYQMWGLDQPKEWFNKQPKGVPTQGEWAEQQDLTHPSQTAWSLESPMNDGRAGTMAYRGTIPPEAIQFDPEHVGKVGNWVTSTDWLEDMRPRLQPDMDDVTMWREARVSANEDHQALLDANAGKDLTNLPGATNVPGMGPLQFHSNGDIQRIANEYNQENGLGAHPTDYLPVDPQKAAQVAQEFERMPHDPQNPQVQSAYQALANETRAQYNKAVQNGYRFEFYPRGEDPYPNSPRQAVLDLHRNKHMYVYPTEAGFGSEDQPQDHPLLQDSGVRWNGQPVTHNDLFRAVHDFYGHAKEGVGFRGHGEDNAYRQHQAMFSPQAQQALMAETRAQNHWLNYGPYGENNQNAKLEDTVFAPQKAGIMPQWTQDPNLHQPNQPMPPQPVVAYHRSPKENRESIEAKGLIPNWDPTMDVEPGVFVTPQIPMGKDASGEDWWDMGTEDLWKIDATSMDLKVDHWGDGYMAEHGGSFYVSKVIPPSKLSRVDPVQMDLWKSATIEDNMSDSQDTSRIPNTRQASTLGAIVDEAVRHDGGITIDLQGNRPSAGYAFSIQNANEQVVPLNQWGINAADDYIAAHTDDLSAPGRYLGAWTNKGSVYLDVSQIEQDYDAAAQAATAAGQLAMFDLGSGKEIPLPQRPSPMVGELHNNTF